MMDYDTVGVVFTWVLLTLTSFRLQRLVTSDHWPPSQWFRRAIDARFGPTSSWAELFNCPWCFGSWTTIAVFAIASQVMDIPLPILQGFAASAAVGYLGTYDGSAE